MGIGGEYAAINSVIDELIPGRYRGRVDIAVNGTYWAGAILGTLGTFIFLKAIDLSLGWRLAFLLGPVLGLVILVVRRNLPESPRWLVMNGRVEEAERTISYIEHDPTCPTSTARSSSTCPDPRRCGGCAACRRPTRGSERPDRTAGASPSRTVGATTRRPGPTQNRRITREGDALR
jgi:MFS family permease